MHCKNFRTNSQIIDLNRDGLLDIIIGEQSGTINYCENTGSLTNAIFDTIIEYLGGIDIESNIISSGFSTPKFYDNNGSFELYTGSFTGETYVYDNIENNLFGTFDSLTVLNLKEGGKNMVAIEDINNDQKPDLLIGNYSGGLSFFSSDSSVISHASFLNFNELNIYPNPTNRYLTIESKELGNIEIINTLGQIVLKEDKLKQRKKIDIDYLKSGVYIVKFSNQIRKIIIK